MNREESRPYVSPTQLEMYWRCGEQYRRRYIEGEKLPPGIALLQGSAVHQGAEMNMRQKVDSKQDLPAAEIIDCACSAFETGLAGGYALNEDEEKIGARKVLGEALDMTARLAQGHADLQAPHYQPVEVEHTSRIVLPGSHDLLTVTDVREKEVVTDFKTAGRAKPESEVHDSAQLTCYAAAFKADHGRLPKKVRLDVLTKTKEIKRQVLESVRDEEDFEVLARRINVTVNAIHAGTFPPASTGHWMCSSKWCGYWHTCPYVRRRGK